MREREKWRNLEEREKRGVGDEREGFTREEKGEEREGVKILKACGE